MNGFDFSDIERVNRIELKPGEMVLFRSPEPLSSETIETIRNHFKGTPLEGNVLLLTGDWEVDTIDPGESL